MKLDLEGLRRKCILAEDMERDTVVVRIDEMDALLARAEVYEAAVALITAEDMPPHTPFDGNSPEWDAKFDAEHAARKALRAALARVQEVENG